MWDGSEYSLGITMGSNFADGRGNATLFFGYTSTDAVLQSERDYSACAISTSGLYCGGSSTSYPGRFRPLKAPERHWTHELLEPRHGCRPAT